MYHRLQQYLYLKLVAQVLNKSYIILRSKTAPRKGWGKSFKKMHKNGDDELLKQEIFLE